MKKTNIILGLIILIAPWLLFEQKMRELNVEEQGQIVKMKIIDIPGSCLGTKAKWSMKIEYRGVIYSKKIPGNYCEEHRIGDWVDIKYLEGTDILLLPTDSVWGDIYAGIAMSLFGLFSILYYLFIKKD